MAPWDNVSSSEAQHLQSIVNIEGDLNEYLDEWNESILSSCDILAVYPATAGRLSDYCHLGVRRRGKGNWQSCNTADARMLGGISQIVNHDTWLEELRDVRVLVIHRHAGSIVSQYRTHVDMLERSQEGLFGTNYPHALPVFKELMSLVPPVQNNDWKVQINQLQQQLLSLATEFDIVLIGDVPYAPLLSKFIKEMGLSSIDMGDTLEAHFAVIGAHSKRNAYVHILNSNWVLPPL